MRAFALAAAALLFSSGLLTPSAASEDLPSGKDVIDRFVEVTGGEKAWASIQTLEMSGELQLPAMGMSATMNTLFSTEGDYRIQVDIPGAGQQVQGSTGGVVWELSLMSGPRILEGEEARATVRHSDVAWHRKLDEYYSSVECTGTKEFAGETCYEVRMTTKEGEVETQYFSVESGLQLGMAMTVKHQMGDIPATGTFDNYEDFGGVLMATRMVQSAAGMEQIIELKEVQVNPPLSEEAFALPLEVEALLEPAGK